MIGVRRQLLDAGQPLETIDHMTLAANIAAFLKWTLTTEEGAIFILECLQMECSPGSEETHYEIVRQDGFSSEVVEPKNILEAKGYFVNGQFTSPQKIHTEERPSIQCEDCLMLGPCPQEIKKLGVNLCNHCLVCSDNYALRNLGDPRLCEERCQYTQCHHHPQRY